MPGLMFRGRRWRATCLASGNTLSFTYASCRGNAFDAPIESNVITRVRPQTEVATIERTPEVRRAWVAAAKEEQPRED